MRILSTADHLRGLPRSTRMLGIITPADGIPDKVIEDAVQHGWLVRGREVRLSRTGHNLIESGE